MLVKRKQFPVEKKYNLKWNKLLNRYLKNGRRISLELLEYLTEDLDLENKLILDAALGMGRATRHLAEEARNCGEDCRIIAVDRDISAEHSRKIREILGVQNDNVELKEADIFSLDFLEENTVDIINCHDTIVFLNERPLQLLGALKEFKRVLRPAGKLLIASERPLDPGGDPAAEGEWKRIKLMEAAYSLAGEKWADFIQPEELELALDLLGFDVYDQRIFPGEKNEDSFKLPLLESQELIEEKIKELSWSHLGLALEKEMEELRREADEAGYLKAPDKFVLKAELTLNNR